MTPDQKWNTFHGTSLVTNSLSLIALIIAFILTKNEYRKIKQRKRLKNVIIFPICLWICDVCICTFRIIDTTSALILRNSLYTENQIAQNFSIFLNVGTYYFLIASQFWLLSIGFHLFTNLVINKKINYGRHHWKMMCLNWSIPFIFAVCFGLWLKPNGIYGNPMASWFRGTVNDKPGGMPVGWAIQTLVSLILVILTSLLFFCCVVKLLNVISKKLPNIDTYYTLMSQIGWFVVIFLIVCIVAITFSTLSWVYYDNPCKVYLLTVAMGFMGLTGLFDSIAIWHLLVSKPEIKKSKNNISGSSLNAINRSGTLNTSLNKNSGILYSTEAGTSITKKPSVVTEVSAIDIDNERMSENNMSIPPV